MKVFITICVISFAFLCLSQNVFSSSFETLKDSNTDIENNETETFSSDYTPIRYLLSDKNYSDKKIYIRGGNSEGDGVVNQFVENVTMSLLEDITEINNVENMNLSEK